MVKGNTPTLLDAIVTKMPRPYDGSADHTEEEIVGGRRLIREIWVVDADGIDFPHARQVFRIRRQVFDLSGHRLSKEYVHGATSFTAEAASALQLLDAVRRHWRIETAHQIRDVTWREDHQHAYTRNGAHVVATMHNIALAVHTVDRLSPDHPHPATHRRRPRPVAADPGPLPTPSMIN